MRIVDDDSAVRDSLKFLIENMQLGVECFESAEQFLETYDASIPGCVLIDIRMADMGGLELQSLLNRQGSSLPVVIISGHATVAATVRAMKQGAVNLLEKPFQPAELRDSIRQAVAADALRRNEQALENEIGEKIRQLTASEARVLDAVLAGHPTKQIAANLDISLRTVQSRLTVLKSRFGASSTIELVSLVSRAYRP